MLKNFSEYICRQLKYYWRNIRSKIDFLLKITYNQAKQHFAIPIFFYFSECL